MTITGGFGVSVDLETGASRAWYMGQAGQRSRAMSVNPDDAMWKRLDLRRHGDTISEMEI